MPKRKYKDFDFKKSSLDIITQANAILEEYDAQGYVITLRQLYYQFVARGLLANRQQNYRRLGSIINDARLAGLVDWAHMEDRTRFVRSLSSWADPSQIVGACASQFRVDMWATQKNRIEVWIEKDALVGVIEGVCNDLRVPFFSCRGFTSQSEMWAAAQRLVHWRRSGQAVTILHLGDFDPSGVDMSRDIEERLALFMGDAPEFERLALNMPQVEQYSPPPNPAKATDSRFAAFSEKYGDESWELDALEPTVIGGLIRSAVEARRDLKQWKTDTKEENEHRESLKRVASRWSDVCDYLTGDDDAD